MKTNKIVIFLLIAFIASITSISLILYNKLLNKENQEALIKSIELNDAPTFKELLSDGYGLANKLYSNGNTLLHIATSNQSLEAVNSLIKHNLFNDLQNKEGKTPLYIAIEKRNQEITKILLESGANVEKKDNKGISVNDIAKRSRGTDIYGLIVEIATPQVKTDLIYAIKSGQIREVNKILRDGVTPDTIDNNTDEKHSLLHLAVINNDEEILKTLLSRGANINITNINGNTPLHIAVRNEYLSIAKILLKKNARPRIANNDRALPIHIAIKKGNIKIFRLLIRKNGAIKNAKDNKGNSFYHYSAMGGNKNILREIRKIDSNPDLKNNNGKTPLDIAIENNHKEIIPFFKGESINTSICEAIQYMEEEQIIKLLNSPTNLNTKCPNHNGGNSPFHAIIQQANFPHSYSINFEKIIQTMIDRGADVKSRDSLGGTALHTALMHPTINLETIQILLNNGANINAKTRHEGLTPLHLSAMYANPYIVDHLIKNGADIEAKDIFGLTPLESAKNNPTSMKNPEVIKILEYAKKKQNSNPLPKTQPINRPKTILDRTTTAIRPTT